MHLQFIRKIILEAQAVSIKCQSILIASASEIETNRQRNIPDKYVRSRLNLKVEILNSINDDDVGSLYLFSS